MYNRQPCFTDDSCQLSYEHLRQLECTGHFRASAEVSPFKFVSGQQVSDGGKECFDRGLDVEASLGAEDYHIYSVAKDTSTSFTMRTDDISSVFTANVFDRARVFSSSLASEYSLGTTRHSKHPWSHFCEEAVSKRARQEDQAAKPEHCDGNSLAGIVPPDVKLSEEAEWTISTSDVGANAKRFEAGCEIDQLEDAYFQISDHYHWKHVPVGPDHQADLPEWMSRDSNTASSVASDKWLGTCVVPMPDRDSFATEARSCYPKFVCDCTGEGSIECVRKHVIEAREKLIRALGQEQFIRIGFSHMGEIVAQRWDEEEENLFHEVVLSNPESAGRNFWVMLRKAFPSSNFKELVSYYFNVFVLRKRAHQNRLDLSNVDSDNDEWQENGDVEGLKSKSVAQTMDRICSAAEDHHDFLECRNDGVINLGDYEHDGVNGDLNNLEN